MVKKNTKIIDNQGFSEIKKNLKKNSIIINRMY
jgi:hypothetical protein